MSREILAFVEAGTAVSTILLIGKVDASGFLAIISLILHLRTIYESSGSSVTPVSRTFPLFLGVPVSFDSGKSSVMLAFASTLIKGAAILQ